MVALQTGRASNNFLILSFEGRDVQRADCWSSASADLRLQVHPKDDGGYDVKAAERFPLRFLCGPNSSRGIRPRQAGVVCFTPAGGNENL